MTRDELLACLERCRAMSNYDAEVAHGDADDALVAYINDPEITAVYEAIARWYA